MRKFTLPEGFENEPDIAKGYHCGLAYRIIRHPVQGHLCGYVKLPLNHPWLKEARKKRWGPRWFSKKYQRTEVGYDYAPISRVRVHGGVTFFGTLRRGRGHWIGFDCAHCDDYVPGMVNLGLTLDGTYRSIDYARMECFRMA